MKSKRSKATDIPTSVKKKVWERDNHCCVVCGNSYNVMPNAHFLPRGAKLGLGIEQNIVTLCQECHFKMDNTKYRNEYLRIVKDYLISCYSDWEQSYEMAYKSLITHSNYWLKKMEKKLYYDGGKL